MPGANPSGDCWAIMARQDEAGESEGAVAPAPRRGSKFDLVVKFCPPSRLSDDALMIQF